MKINESINDDNYTQKVVSVMKPPYIDDLRMFKIPTEKWEEVFSLLFNKDINSIELDRNINRDATILYVDIPTNPPKLPLYVEWDNGPWLLRDYDDNGNMIYYEESDGYWEKYEFDNDSNPTYYENSEGYSDDYSENSLNESINDKENMVIDKIVNFMLEDTQYKIKTIKDEFVVRIVYPFYGDKIYTEEWGGIDYYLDNLVGDYPLDVIHVDYINNQYGITDTSLILDIFNRYIKILFTKLKKELESKMENDSLNESINDKENMVIDKIVNFMLEDTQTTLSKQEGEPVIKISYPFYSEQIVIMKWWDLNYYLDNLVDDYTLSDVKVNYISNQYGITDTSLILDIFNKYILLLFTKLKKELESKMENDSLNESINDRRKNYLDKVLEYILSDTQIEPHPMWPSDWLNISVPFTSLVYSRIIHFDREDFFTYCRDTYGLTKFETYGMWEDYVDEVNQILKNDWGISDPVYH